MKGLPLLATQIFIQKHNLTADEAPEEKLFWDALQCMYEPWLVDMLMNTSIDVLWNLK